MLILSFIATFSISETITSYPTVPLLCYVFIAALNSFRIILSNSDMSKFYHIADLFKRNYCLIPLFLSVTYRQVLLNSTQKIPTYINKLVVYCYPKEERSEKKN